MRWGDRRRVKGRSLLLWHIVAGLWHPALDVRCRVAALVTVWIPARLFWAYLVGVAFLAAGLSLVTKVKADLAGTLLGIRFRSWALVRHAPRVAPT